MFANRTKISWPVFTAPGARISRVASTIVAMLVTAAALLMGLTASASAAPPCANPQTQIEMNACAAEQAAAAEAAMKKRFDEAVGAVQNGELAKKLIASQVAWESYRDAQCAFEGAQYEGGSIQPMIIHTCRATAAERRAQVLESAMTP